MLASEQRTSPQVKYKSQNDKQAKDSQAPGHGACTRWPLATLTRATTLIVPSCAHIRNQEPHMLTVPWAPQILQPVLRAIVAVPPNHVKDLSRCCLPVAGVSGRHPVGQQLCSRCWGCIISIAGWEGERGCTVLNVCSGDSFLEMTTQGQKDAAEASQWDWPWQQQRRVWSVSRGWAAEGRAHPDSRCPAADPQACTTQPTMH